MDELFLSNLDSSWHPVIKEITVEASNKTWGGASSGESGGTSITWTLTPNNAKLAWTEAQAREVTLKARKEIQLLLISDAMVRGAPLPRGGKEALTAYDVAINDLGTKSEPDSDTIDSEV